MEQIQRSPVEEKAVYPIIYRVLAPSQVVGNGISSINSITHDGSMGWTVYLPTWMAKIYGKCR